MRARLVFRDAQGRTGEVRLSPDTPIYIGRALDCSVRTDDAMVSRRHTVVRMERGSYLVEDLGSSNGTHVNDAKVAQHLLNHNDVVRCGNLWLRYIEDSSPLGTTEGEIATPQAPPPAPAPAPPPFPGAAPPPGAAAPATASDRAPTGGGTVAVGDGRWRETYNPGAAMDDTVDLNDENPFAAGGAASPYTGSIQRAVGSTMPRRLQSPDATPIGSGPGAPPVRSGAGSGPATRPSGLAGPAGDLSDRGRELERRLMLVATRAAEIEMALGSLQAEIRSADRKVETLLAAVRELARLKPG